MRLAAVLGVLILTILGFWACQYSLEVPVKTKNNIIHTALNTIQPKDSSLTFIAEQGFNYQFPTGTNISIPSGALMNKKGELVNGEVSLLFQEYKDAIDLLLSGIPMNLDYGMAKTAGAFKIEVSQFGEKLILDPTKNIKVRFACYEKEEDYSLYLLNEQEHRLDSLFGVPPEMNEEHTQLERSIKRLKPWIKFPLGEDNFAFSYKGILDVIYNKNLTNVNHKLTKKRMQQYGLRWSSLNVETFIDYNGKRELAALMVWQNISKKPLPDWVASGKGSLMKIGKERYRLIVQDSIGARKFSTQVEPVISLRELFAFGPGFWKNDYLKKIEKVAQEESRLAKMPSAFRSFNINHFGIYNWLRQSDEIPSVNLQSLYKLDDLMIGKDDLPGIFYLSADGKGIIHYSNSEFNKMKLYDDPNDRIFTVSEDGAILLFPLDQMSAIEFNQFKKMKEPSFIFKLKKQNKIPSNSEELRAVLHVIP